MYFDYDGELCLYVLLIYLKIYVCRSKRSPYRKIPFKAVKHQSNLNKKLTHISPKSSPTNPIIKLYTDTGIVLEHADVSKREAIYDSAVNVLEHADVSKGEEIFDNVLEHADVSKREAIYDSDLSKREAIYDSTVNEADQSITDEEIEESQVNKVLNIGPVTRSDNGKVFTCQASNGRLTKTLTREVRLSMIREYMLQINCMYYQFS